MSAAPTPNSRSYTPKHLADKILQSRSALEGERKQVTVLFADVKGSMELAEQLDPEAWHAILDRFFQILTDGVHRFEGTVNQYTGDGIMALFGAPIAHEDHAQRACYAALSLRKTLQVCAREVKREHGVGFSTRMGIHSGEVVVGRIGDDLRMDYTAQGHTVGLAQRMESLAEPSTCYLSAATAKLVTGYFELADLGAFRVKGASEAVGVFELRGQGAIRTRLDVSRERGLSRFVGRDADMQSLESALAQAQSGSGQVVGIVAEAGVGKSRLCFEFLERCRAQGMTVLAGHAVAHGKNIPLLPILQAFRDYYGISERDDDRTVREKIAGRLLLLDPGFAEFLPVLFEFFGAPDPERPVPRMDPDAKQRQIFAVIRRVVQGADPKIDRIVAVVEDLHWIDSVSETFLEQWVEAVAGSRFLLLVNFRPEYSAGWTSKSYYRQIPLAPLGPDAVRELLDEMLGHDPSIEGLADAIHERTGGNPFFTEEVVQSLIESGHLAGAKGGYRLVTPIKSLQVPPTVQALLSARIDRLAEREKAVLQAAAVIGKEFAEPILLAATGQSSEQVREAIRTLKEAEFVYEQALYPVAEYAFKHPLTQEVALGSQLQDRRRRTHAAVAEAIEQANAERLDGNAALLAHHWEEAGEAPIAARWHARAAVWAGLNDVRAAFDHWRRARSLAGPEQAKLGADASSQLLALGWRLGMTEGECERVFEEGRALAERAEDLRSLASLTANYAGFRGIPFGRTDDYIRYSLDAVRIADRTGDLALRCGTRAYLIYAYRHGGLVEPGLAACDELEQLLDGDPHLGADVSGFSPLVGVTHCRGALQVSRGDPVDPRAAYGAARQAALDHGYPEMVVWIRWDQIQMAAALRDRDGAVSWARECRELAEHGDHSDLMSRLALARALGFEGNATAKLETATSGLAMQREMRVGRASEPEALQLIAEAQLALGRKEEARRNAAEATALTTGRGTYGYAMGAFGALARGQLALGEPASEIERTLDEYAAAIRHTGMHVFERDLAEVRALLREGTS
jgi:class 3 adenylate cyclase/ABC-type dipeptide/oligopeptide/nickel transport system ATPase component